GRAGPDEAAAERLARQRTSRAARSRARYPVHGRPHEGLSRRRQGVPREAPAEVRGKVMRALTRTLLPLGEKGRDEGTSHPDDVIEQIRAAVSFCRCAESERTHRDARSRPLTLYPLSPKGRGE